MAKKKIPSFRAINSSLDLRVSDTRNHRKQHTKNTTRPSYVSIYCFIFGTKANRTFRDDGGDFLPLTFYSFSFLKNFKAKFFPG